MNITPAPKVLNSPESDVVAQKKVSIDTLLNIVAIELRIDRTAMSLINLNGTHEDEANTSENDHASILCVSEVLKEGCNEVYRFRTDKRDHSMPGPHRYSYNTLLKLWKLANDATRDDGGSFPQTEEYFDGLHGFWVFCECARCSDGIPVQLWCETYDFKSSAISNTVIIIHKFTCGGKPWAVILGEMGFEEWRLWGYMREDKQMFYNSDVQLQSSHSSSTPLSGREKRAAQQSIEVVGVQHNRIDGAIAPYKGRERTEDNKDDEQPVRIHRDRRRRSVRSKSPKRVHGHDSGNQRTPQRSRTPIPKRSAQQGMTDNQSRMDKTLHSATVKSTFSTLSPLSTGAGKPVDADRVSPIPTTEDSLHSKPNAARNTDSATPTAPISSNASIVPSHQILSGIDNINIQHSRQPADPIPDLKDALRKVFYHVKSQQRIEPGSEMQQNIQALREASDDSDQWQFGLLRDMIDHELARAGLEPLPTA